MNCLLIKINFIFLFFGIVIYCLPAKAVDEVGVLGELALQFAFVAQFEVLEAEGGGHSAAHQAETGFRWDVSREPVSGLYYHLHLVIGE